MIIASFAILAVIAVVIYAIARSSRQTEKTNDERTIELLRKARLMFPSAENDIFALDALYQHTFRELLIAQKKGKTEWEDLKRDSILIFNTKNRAIMETVQFEERSVRVLPIGQATLRREPYSHSHN